MVKALFPTQKLDAQKLKKVATGKRKYHKGWRLLYGNTETA